MAERQIPGGAYYNDQGTTREAQIPGAQYVNEEAAAAAGQQFLMTPARLDGIGHGGIFPGGRVMDKA